MINSTDTEGLEFVKAWDRNVLSIISLFPVAISLGFAAAWIVVSIVRYEVDAQVAVQTAFTVSGFIVTAGKPKRDCFLAVSDW